MTSQSNGTKEDYETNQNDVSTDTDLVTPWDVQAESMAGVNYQKIIGKKLITYDAYRNSL